MGAYIASHIYIILRYTPGKVDYLNGKTTTKTRTSILIMERITKVWCIAHCHY